MGGTLEILEKRMKEENERVDTTGFTTWTLDDHIWVFQGPSTLLVQWVNGPHNDGPHNDGLPKTTSSRTTDSVRRGP